MPDDTTVNESAADETGDQTRPGDDSGEPAGEVREDAAAEMRRAADDDTGSDDAAPQQGTPRTTPTAHEAQAATAARTPSEEAGKQVRARAAQAQEESDDSSTSDTDGDSDSARRASDIVASDEAPLAPLPGRAEPADRDTGSPADSADADEVQAEQEEA